MGRVESGAPGARGSEGARPARGVGVPMSEPARTLSPYMTAEEVAEVLRCTPRSVRNYARQGTLPCIRIGRLVRFRRADVEALDRRPALRVVR